MSLADIRRRTSYPVYRTLVLVVTYVFYFIATLGGLLGAFKADAPVGMRIGSVVAAGVLALLTRLFNELALMFVDLVDANVVDAGSPRVVEISRPDPVDSATPPSRPESKPAPAPHRRPAPKREDQDPFRENYLK